MKSGIYKIVNMITGEYYLGSSKDLNRRRCNHFGEIKRQKHPNLYLQNVVIKYGFDSFEFKILFYCDPADLLFFEQRCLDILKPEYNISKNASAPMDGRKHNDRAIEKISMANKGKKHTEVTKQKISRAKIGTNPNKGCKFTNETKARMSVAQTGNKKMLGKKHSDETRMKMSLSAFRREAMKKKWLSLQIGLWDHLWDWAT